MKNLPPSLSTKQIDSHQLVWVYFESSKCQRPIGYLQTRQKDPSQKASFQFQYLPGSEVDISLSLPRFSKKRNGHYFHGLLPENQELLKKLGLRYRVHPQNTGALLGALGGDCPGAVFFENEYWEEKDPGSALRGKVLQDGVLASLLQKLPQNPLLAGVEGLRLTLSGFQPKTALSLIEDQICFPVEGSLSTHLVKPTLPILPSMVLNEYFCLMLSKKLGFQTVEVALKGLNLGTGEHTLFLWIKRFDRFIENGFVYRRHQEDFCQALGMHPAQKYEFDGGPGLKDCFDLLSRTQHPAQARLEFMERLFFYWIIGNLGAHGKNFSFILNDDGFYQLAPVYDVLCTRAYPGLSHHLAMSVGGAYKPEEISKEAIQIFCQEIGFSYPGLSKKIRSLSSRILNRAESLRAEMRSDLTAAPFFLAPSDLFILDTVLKVIHQQVANFCRIIS
jgi:serine/threonine-protein kinase HipA